MTTMELRSWRARAASGPYRDRGDAGPGSPGDWRRMEHNRDRFVADPDAARWSGPGDGDGCVRGGDRRAAAPGEVHLSLVRDAAFVALVTADAELRALAAEELVAQSREPGVDFADPSRWCREVIFDRNPGFEIANWLTSLLYALEYIEIADGLEGTSSLSDEEVRGILGWMHAAAAWMAHDTDAALAKNFTDRAGRDGPPYTLSAGRRADPVIDAAAYDGSGEVIGAIARYYNNRRAQKQRFVGLLALHLLERGGPRPGLAGDGPSAEALLDSAERFAEDYLAYSVYPDGFTGEFHRATEGLPDLGWGYAVGALAPVLTFAEAAARTGDPTVLELVTSEGVHGTQGAPEGEPGKSYRWLVSQLLGYLDGTHERFLPGRAGDPDFLIDGIHPPKDWEAAHDLALMPATRYWGDPYHATVILRTAPGTRPWSDEPEGYGSYEPWTGDWGTLPGVLFMFAEGPGAADPYPAATVADEDAGAGAAARSSEGTAQR